MQKPTPPPRRACAECGDTLRKHEPGPHCQQCLWWHKRLSRAEEQARGVRKQPE